MTITLQGSQDNVYTIVLWFYGILIPANGTYEYKMSMVYHSEGTNLRSICDIFYSRSIDPPRQRSLQTGYTGIHRRWCFEHDNNVAVWEMSLPVALRETLLQSGRTPGSSLVLFGSSEKSLYHASVFWYTDRDSRKKQDEGDCKKGQQDRIQY